MKDTAVIARADDWEGIYIAGVLVAEDHSLDTIDMMNLAIERGLEDKVVSREVDYEWMADRGTLPELISDVKWIAGS